MLFQTNFCIFREQEDRSKVTALLITEKYDRNKKAISYLHLFSIPILSSVWDRLTLRYSFEESRWLRKFFSYIKECFSHSSIKSHHYKITLIFKLSIPSGTLSLESNRAELVCISWQGVFRSATKPFLSFLIPVHGKIFNASTKC